MALKSSQLRDAMRVLKMKPTKDKLDVFFEYVVIMIEELEGKIDELIDEKNSRRIQEGAGNGTGTNGRERVLSPDGRGEAAQSGAR